MEDTRAQLANIQAEGAPGRSTFVAAALGQLIATGALTISLRWSSFPAELLVPPIHGVTAIGIGSLLPLWLAASALGAGYSVRRLGSVVTLQAGLIIIAIGAAGAGFVTGAAESQRLMGIVSLGGSGFWLATSVLSVGAMLVAAGAIVSVYGSGNSVAAALATGAVVGLSFVPPATYLLVGWGDWELTMLYVAAAVGAAALALYLGLFGQLVLAAKVSGAVAAATLLVAGVWWQGLRITTFLEMHTEMAFYVVVIGLILSGAVFADNRSSGSLLTSWRRLWAFLIAIGLAVAASGAAFRSIQAKVLFGGDVSALTKVSLVIALFLFIVIASGLGGQLTPQAAHRWLLASLVFFAVLRRIGGPLGLVASLAVFGVVFALYTVMMLRASPESAHGDVVGLALFVQIAVPAVWLFVTAGSAPVGRTPIVFLGLLLVAAIAVASLDADSRSGRRKQGAPRVTADG